MFVGAIDTASKFTRPIHSIARTFGSNLPIPGAATLFFVNKDGWALTCKHVAEQVLASGNVNQQYSNYKQALAAGAPSKNAREFRRKLQKTYNYAANSAIELYFRFINCVQPLKLSAILHPTYDAALIKFEEFTQMSCSSFPVFATDDSALRQGKFLCRLGFPFPEFTNFEYDQQSDSIRWTQTGIQSTPQFPLEGMLTRHLIDNNQKPWGFEMSTPGLRGQSGGPAFDAEGKVWGMQYATNHLDLDFDVNQMVMRSGVKKQVTDSAFLHVGYCIHVAELKAFMRQHNVQFAEA